MAKQQKLKVFRTAIGFHDAYVAAPSQKAALEAWGANSNLFARGVAEIVTDPKLSAAPLANPGKVLKVSRGTATQQLAALTETPRKPAPPSNEKSKSPVVGKEAPPRPSRARLEAAESALADAQARHEREGEEIALREAEFRQARETLRKAQAAERAKLEARRDHQEDLYRRAVDRWRSDTGE